ncbi:hypothetical protein [Streptomyces sp. NBC_01268]|uniref:hypothetical protein n=1 Tax=unclassified Streptomyces TaxID=2593676 RepID=UPI002E335EB7|nr:hypothetical protein [Streptomyces sp. NBC_01268]
MVRTRLKLAATLTVVVLALTGFQTSSSGGHGGGSGKSGSRSGKSKSGGDSGGGCSSSKKRNDDYDGGGSGDGTYTPSPTASTSTAPTAGVEVVVVDCVEPARKKRKGRPAVKADTTATLRITSRDATAGTYRIVVEFKGSLGSKADGAETVVTVGGGETKTFEVAMRNPKAVDKVKDCYVYDVRRQPEGTPTPTPTAS